MKKKKRNDKHLSGEGDPEKRLAEGGPVIAHRFFQEDWLAQYGLDLSRCSLTRLDGTGMEPALEDNSMILVDHQRSELVDDGIFHVRIGDRYVVGRARRHGKRWRLVRDAPGSEDLDLPPAAEVVGQVVWTGKTLLREDQDRLVAIPCMTWEAFEKEVMSETRSACQGEMNL